VGVTESCLVIRAISFGYIEHCPQLDASSTLCGDQPVSFQTREGTHINTGLTTGRTISECGVPHVYVNMRYSERLKCGRAIILKNMDTNLK
jgi:hypothetical protein